ncbi:hypothetical protein [Staphylococcus epidermidis]|uniref:hypothetical protein n=3 Tax=Staphylococcus epidermidis TaxID=1282 RepID=UPI0038B4C5FB
MKNKRLIYTRKPVSIYELIQYGYKYKCRNGKTYINIGNGYCIHQTYLIKNDLLMQRIRTVNNISNIILSVFDSNNRLIFKRNRKGILVKIRFVKRKEKFAIEQSINTNN